MQVGHNYGWQGLFLGDIDDISPPIIHIKYLQYHEYWSVRVMEDSTFLVFKWIFTRPLLLVILYLIPSSTGLYPLPSPFNIPILVPTLSSYDAISSFSFLGKPVIAAVSLPIT